MPKYVMYIPVYASAKFTLESKTPLTDDEVREKILQDGGCEGSLCHQCSRDIETDFTPDCTSLDKLSVERDEEDEENDDS